VVTEVIGGSPQNFQQTVEINRGSRDGIREGMPVVNAAGLVGKITKVYLDRAVVLLLIDPSYAVTVKVVSVPDATVEVPGIEVPPPTTSTTVPETSVDSPVISPAPDGAPNPGDETTGEPVSTSAPALPTTLAPEFTVPPGEAPPGVDSVPGTSAVGPVAEGDGTEVSVPTTLAPVQTGVRETGGLEGQGPDRAPKVRFLGRDIRAGTIAVGDLVTTAGGTSNLASLAPAGIQIGRVSRVIDRPSSAGPELEVDPVVDFDRLNFLIVLRYVPPSEAPNG
jgi:rod shape-determining protein MreC